MSKKTTSDCWGLSILGHNMTLNKSFIESIQIPYKRLKGFQKIKRNDIVVFKSGSQNGFGSTANQDANYKSALRFINCLTTTGGKLKFRDEEDQISSQYFCRAKAGHFNFSNNPTFVSGSQNELRISSMKGNPSTFITQVQLYNSAGDMVAVGNLSTPLQKNFSKEAVSTYDSTPKQSLLVEN